MRAAVAMLAALPLMAQTVQVYETYGDRSRLLERRPDLGWTASAGSEADLAIAVNEATRYQTMDGFGASLTHSAGWLIANKLSAAERDKLLFDLFDPNFGAGLSLLRQPMGASDFTNSVTFSYSEKPDLSDFSIAPDLEFTVPLLRRALAANPSLRLIATPWSPPGWMKSSNTMKGGSIRADQFPALARYFVKFLEAYRREQLPVYAVTVQNEPLYSTSGYPSAAMAARDQAAFIASHLGPALASAFPDTRILAYDHNWDHPEYPETVLADAAARPFVAGTAFHCYGGDVAAQGRVKAAYPDKGIWFTECSGTAGSSFAGDLAWNTRNLLIGATRNWGRSVILWNLALDQNSGPKNGGCDKCRGVITIDTSTSPATITRNVEYYVLAHLAKFVRPGAQRIESNGGAAGGLMDVAFRNPDGSLALLVLNDAAASRTFSLEWQAKRLTHTLPAGAVATLAWNTPKPSFAAAGVINAAHPMAALSPGAIFSLYGTELAAGAGGSPLVPLARTIEGASVLVGDRPAPLIFVSPLQINGQIPWESAAGTATISVLRNGERASREIALAPLGPALFTVDGEQAAALNEDGSANMAGNPVPAGKIAVLFGTGGGASDPAAITGEGAPSDSPSLLRAMPTAEAGGRPVTPDFAGLAPGFAGLVQVNLRIPEGTAGGAAPVVLMLDGVRSNTVTVYVR